MEDSILSVTKFIQQMKIHIEGEFRFVSVEGEISNLSYSSAGHYYFTLSDGESSLSAALFKFDVAKNPIMAKIKNGDKVVCRGPITLYAKRGTFQLVAKIIQDRGQGDLLQKFEQLKKKLASEGLFDLERKRKIPLFPKKIAIITALKGAALQDFLHIFRRRSFSMDILIIPSLVQGELAPASLIKALKLAYSRNDLEVIVLARGGGSLEDLFAFNDENLARVIAQSPIPTMSAIGHQVDFSIADYVSDLRVETPSAAAEFLTSWQLEINQKLEKINKVLLSRILLTESKIKNFNHRYNPKTLFSIIERRVINWRKRFSSILLKERIHELLRTHEFHYILDENQFKIKKEVDLLMSNIKNKLTNNYSLLNSLNPRGILKRGYSFVEDDEKNIIGSFEQFQGAKEKNVFHIVFHDGRGAVTRKGV